MTGKLKRVIGSPAAYENLEFEAQDHVWVDVERAIDEAIKKWGENINCFNLHLELKNLWPRAICWRNEGHVITEIDGMLFDKSGKLFARMSSNDPEFKKGFRMPARNGEF